MGNKEMILAITKDLRNLANSLEGLIGATEELDSSCDETNVQTSETVNEVAVKLTIEDVRAVLAVKTREGKTPQVKVLLNEFGADKLSNVPVEKLAELKAKAEVL